MTTATTQRPSAQDFLELVERGKRGRLKLYVGFAAGVGKTWRMLEEAHALRQRGVDVVGALVETHGRAETEALVKDFEVVPRRKHEYRGVVVDELDLDAVLARRPAVAVVDEIPHTNVPGSKNRKRYQDVLDLLGAGINVIGALNIQHLESLNDLIQRNTGVQVRETVPDSFLKQADQVVNLDLAKLYGLSTTGLTSTTFTTMALPATGPRAGILSKAAALSVFANQQSGSPTLRGKFIRESLMCLTVPPPPPGVNTAAVDQPTDVPMTKRQRLEAHRAAPACAGCHSLMDPLGLPLESYDAIGKYRTTDNGLPVDPTSTFDGQAIADSKGLGVVASQSVTVAQCLVRKYYAYAVGHQERDVDGSVLNSVATAFKASGFKLRDLILAIVTNDAFSTVAPQL